MKSEKKGRRRSPEVPETKETDTGNEKIIQSGEERVRGSKGVPTSGLD